MHKQEFDAVISSKGTIKIPKSLAGLTNHAVRVVLYDIGEQANPGGIPHLRGALQEYANPKKASLEKTAMAKALLKKHDTA